SDAPNHLQRIVRRCLAKDPEDRYQTIKDVAIELRELRRELAGSAGIDTTVPPSTAATTLGSADSAATASGAPVSTGPASSAEYLIIGIKQHKIAAVMVLAALVLGALGLVAYLRARNTGIAIDSIAVLPFVNATGDPNTEYLGDGITESIINSLSQLPNLGVIARNSAFRYKGKDTDAPTVGRELKVRSVLTGRVVQHGDNLLISVDLVDASNNHQLWGQQYNRKVADVFAVQEEIAKEISEKLRLKLSGTAAKRPTENLKAFQFYMQSRAFIQRSTREDLLTAIRYCEEAIEEDHNHAPAYAGLADANLALGGRGPVAPIEGRRNAAEAARKALALDHNLAEAHAALGASYALFSPSDFSLGDSELRRA